MWVKLSKNGHWFCFNCEWKFAFLFISIFFFLSVTFVITNALENQELKAADCMSLKYTQNTLNSFKKNNQ